MLISCFILFINQAKKQKGQYSLQRTHNLLIIQEWIQYSQKTENMNNCQTHASI